MDPPPLQESSNRRKSGPVEHFLRDLNFGRDIDFVIGITATALTADQFLKAVYHKKDKAAHIVKAGLAGAAAFGAYKMYQWDSERAKLHHHHRRRHSDYDENDNNYRDGGGPWEGDTEGPRGGQEAEGFAFVPTLPRRNSFQRDRLGGGGMDTAGGRRMRRAYSVDNVDHFPGLEEEWRRTRTHKS